MPDDRRPMHPPPDDSARRRLMATVAGGAVLVAVVIGGILAVRGNSDDQTDYDDAVADRFLSVCTTDATDLGFSDPGGFCQCSYDRIQAEIAFERFVEIDDAAALGGDAGAVPDDIDRIRVDCFAGTASATRPTFAPVPSVTAAPTGG